MSITIGISFTEVTCCVCGVIYALEDSYHRTKFEQKERGTTYCPNGHAWHFRGQSLDSRIAQLQLIMQARDNQLQDERQKCERLERRVKKGICLYCKRTFGNLAAHMNHKHQEKL